MVYVLSMLCVLLWTLPVAAGTYYLSPIGNNGNNGTSTSTPWQTFSFAIPRLNPGDTLFLLNGTYTTAQGGGIVTGSTDVVSIKCGTNAVNGTAGNVITIKALNERQAQILGSGKTTFYLYGCSYWTVDGLYLRNIDINPGSGYEGATFIADQSDHITVRRNLLYGPNAWFNSHALTLYNTHDSLIEENELYYFTRHGLIQSQNENSNDSYNNTIRRNYLHSRDHNSMPGGYTCSGSCENSRGDEGISCYPCRNSIIENNIVEDVELSYTIQCSDTCNDVRYYGNVAMSGGSFYATARTGGGENTANQMPTDTVYLHNVAYAMQNHEGFLIRTGKRTVLTNNTVINGQHGGVYVDNSCGAACGEGGDGHTSVTGTNMLVLTTTGTAYTILDQESQAFTFLRNFGNTSNGFPSGATNTSTSDPTLGACRVYLPAGSNVKGSGLAGADIGANILYRYVDGTLTITSLWNTSTGAFTGCGAIVAGVNDVAGSSCYDVHTRLNVNTNGCPLPTTSTGTLPIPTNLRLGP